MFDIGARARETRFSTGTWERWVCSLVLFLSTSLMASSASAIPYFNAPFGFDNSSLTLAIDVVIPLDAVFPPIASGDTTTDLVLLSQDEINDTGNMIDRTITWTLINTVPDEIDEFLVFLTALQTLPGDHDYSNALIDVDILGLDSMDIASFGSLTFAGFRMSLDDFTLVNGELTATREFRYTVDEGEAQSGPPNLGVAYVAFPSVPEPGTGLLLSTALALGVATSARRSRCV